MEVKKVVKKMTDMNNSKKYELIDEFTVKEPVKSVSLKYDAKLNDSDFILIIEEPTKITDFLKRRINERK